MKNEQILKKAIEKAVKNGYDFNKAKKISDQIDNIVSRNILFSGADTDIVKSTYGLIYSHDFAKAFFGEEIHKVMVLDKEYAIKSDLYEWQYQLENMVLEEEPLKYLEKYL